MAPLQVVLLLCSLLFACAGSPPQPAPHTPYDLSRAFVAALSGSTVQVKGQCPDGNLTGSGVIIDVPGTGSTVATADHVAMQGCRFTIRGQTFEVVARDTVYDIALLRGPKLAGAPRTLSPDPYVGQGVIAVGYPWQVQANRTEFQVTRGTLSARVDRRYKVTAVFSAGSSGGPVFDEQGRLVGLSVSLWTMHSVPLAGEWFVTPAKEVFDMTRRFTRHFRVEELACRCGAPVPERFYANAVAVCQRAEVLRAHLGFPLTVVSGYRTEAHNHKVGGSKASQHLTASALDLRSYHHTPLELAAAYESLIEAGHVPDGGLGVYDTHIHIDTGRPRRW